MRQPKHLTGTAVRHEHHILPF